MKPVGLVTENCGLGLGLGIEVCSLGLPTLGLGSL